MRAACQHAAVAAVEQKVVDTCRVEKLSPAIERMALANAAGVDLQPGPAKADGTSLAVELEMLTANAGEASARTSAKGTLRGGE